MIMIEYWNKKPKKDLYVPIANIIIILKNLDLMSLAQRMHFLLDEFQITGIALVSINHYQTHRLHLFWDTR